MDRQNPGDFSWDRLSARYRLVMCDIWGVVHDGVRLNPGAADRLREWRDQGRFVLLITNAPRPADVVQAQLDAMGLARPCWDSIVTSGQAGIAALAQLQQPVGFLGTAEDRADLERCGIRIAASGAFQDLACIGLEHSRPAVEDYREQFAALVGEGIRLHCLNPDRVVMRGTVAELCAGALADLYTQLGGEVVWYGKPDRAIYDHALKIAGNPPLSDVLAIGDGLLTDMLGAARLGIAAVYVRGGVHAREPFPKDFAADHGVGGWLPLATVDGLA